MGFWAKIGRGGLLDEARLERPFGAARGGRKASPDCAQLWVSWGSAAPTA